MLDKYGVPLYEEHMVKHLLDQIISPYTELNKEFNICRSSHLSKFVKSSTYLSTVVVRLYPSTNSSSGRFIKRSIYATGSGDCGSGRGGRFNVKGRNIGRGGRGGRGIGVHIQGVLDEAAVPMEMKLTSQMSPITLKIQSGPYSQIIQGKGSLRTRCSQSSWQIKIGAPPALSVLKRITKIG